MGLRTLRANKILKRKDNKYDHIGGRIYTPATKHPGSKRTKNTSKRGK